MSKIHFVHNDWGLIWPFWHHLEHLGLQASAGYLQTLANSEMVVDRDICKKS